MLFAIFFKNKIMNIVCRLVNSMPLLSVVDVDVDVDSKLQCFKTIKKDGCVQIFKKAKKTCAIDPMPVSEIVNADNFYSFMDFLPRIVNASISLCKFPNSEIPYVIIPVLKGKLDYQDLSS